MEVPLYSYLCVDFIFVRLMLHSTVPEQKSGVPSLGRHGQRIGMEPGARGWLHLSQ
jgi:hypothetical protein